MILQNLTPFLIQYPIMDGYLSEKRCKAFYNNIQYYLFRWKLYFCIVYK